jgi:hypothetical protein
MAWPSVQKFRKKSNKSKQLLPSSAIDMQSFDGSPDCNGNAFHACMILHDADL